jgi:hypothetical protein
MNRPVPVPLKQTIDWDEHLRFLQKWAPIRGPVFTWQAINVCIRHNKQFPYWVIDYLAQCADRIRSDSAKEASDARQSLRWVFGFPKTHKSGPGGVLNQDREFFKDADEWFFAVAFCQELGESGDPVDARAKACNRIFGADGPEDKQLVRILQRVFARKKIPQNAEACVRLLKSFNQYVKTIADFEFD